MSLIKLGQKAKRINVRLLALEEAKANSGLIAELNRQQLTVGENSKGNPVGSYVTQRYASFKKRIGSQSPLGVPDLKLSGALYEGIKADVREKDIRISSSVSYAKVQEARYGIEIFNLQDDNWEEIEFKVLTGTIKEYLKLMGL